MMSEVCHAPRIGTVMGVTSVIWSVIGVSLEGRFLHRHANGYHQRGNLVCRRTLGVVESPEMAALSLRLAWLGGNE